jgi:hypothetical protein
MEITPLPFRSSIAQYMGQATKLLEAWRAGDKDAIELV